MTDITLMGASVAVLASIMTQLVKPFLDQKYHALLAILSGVLFGALAGVYDPYLTIVGGCVLGFISGASAAGLYKTGKDITQ